MVIFRGFKAHFEVRCGASHKKCNAKSTKISLALKGAVNSSLFGVELLGNISILPSQFALKMNKFPRIMPFNLIDDTP